VKERRSFLENSWFWVKLSATAALCYPLFRFLHYRVPKKPRLVRVNQQLLEGEVYLAPDFALFQGATHAWAVSRTCTHLGCRLNYNEEENLLICPCHKSKFTTEGKMVAGPAVKDLPGFKAEKMTGDGKGYVVTLFG
jgi:Rieske Fe-S protein